MSACSPPTALDYRHANNAVGAVMRLFLRFVVGAAGAAPLLAGAATYTWTGLGSSSNWQELTNWNPTTGYAGASPADVGILPASSQNYAPIINGPITLTTVQFDSQAYVVSVTSSAIIMGGITGSQPGTMAVSSTGILTFANSASAGAAPITVAAQGHVNFLDMSTAGTAAISVNGILKFFSTSSGANAQVSLAGGTLDVSGQTAPLSIGTLFDTAAQPGTVNLGNTALSLGNLNTTNTIYGAISGNGSLTKIGTGVLTLEADNTYTGTTLVQGGVLNIAGSQPGIFSVTNAATLAFTDVASAGASTITVAQPSFISLGSIPLSLGNLGLNDAIFGTIMGNASLTKIGTGTLTLSGANTYVGTTIVQGGTLNLEGSQPGNVTVNANTTLGGGGSVGAVSNSGILRPGGSSSDHLTLSTLSCAAKSTVTLSLDSATYLHIKNTLQASACPVLDITAQTSQSLVSGAQYVLASLDNGSDFTPANVQVHLNAAVTQVHVEPNAIVLQVYTASDYVFANGFDG